MPVKRALQGALFRELGLSSEVKQPMLFRHLWPWRYRLHLPLPPCRTPRGCLTAQLLPTILHRSSVPVTQPMVED
jgi:hypothetical protein